jgi:hypothetical protein
MVENERTTKNFPHVLTRGRDVFEADASDLPNHSVLRSGLFGSGVLTNTLLKPRLAMSGRRHFSRFKDVPLPLPPAYCSLVHEKCSGKLFGGDQHGIRRWFLAIASIECPSQALFHSSFVSDHLMGPLGKKAEQ